jgi:transcriptional regulator with XRE-family HTH domain
MPARRTINLRAQWLGQQLRTVREEARVSIQDIADFMGRNASTTSRMETGMLTARMPEVLAYLDLCEVQEPKRDALKRLAQDAFRKGWWDTYAVTIR